MRIRKLFIFLAAVGLAGVVYGQIVPQQKSPPIFQGDKKNKEDESKARSLSGVVKDDQDNPAEGSVVQLKDTKSLQVRSFITKEDGTYHFYGLSSDVDYQVKADRRNAASNVKTLSVFDSRKAATINLKLEPKKK
jgi:hypothetical protein